VTNLDTHPVETECRPSPGSSAQIEIIEPRLVPLGGTRAMTVRRTLPTRGRSLIGPWCFLDSYGPDELDGRPGMDVPPHPHTGLQTVTWLFVGDVEHRDTVGSHQLVRPGQLNLMTAGRGIAHSEVSLPNARVLHGVQFWVALPDADRNGPPSFEHHGDLPVVDLDGVDGRPGARVVVVMGDLAGARSAATTFSPLVAAEIRLPAGSVVDVPLDVDFEHGVLVDAGDVQVDGTTVAPASLGYAAPGRAAVRLAVSDTEPAVVMLFGGAPFGEDILMWWNFVGRTHEEVVEARAQWQAGLDVGSARFGRVEGYPGPPLSAPELPTVRLVPRSQR
jgi:redox-sensitive bicupin YhaK (pirin superfamily)